MNPNLRTRLKKATADPLKRHFPHGSLYSRSAGALFAVDAAASSAPHRTSHPTTLIMLQVTGVATAVTSIPGLHLVFQSTSPHSAIRSVTNSLLVDSSSPKLKRMRHQKWSACTTHLHLFIPRTHGCVMGRCETQSEQFTEFQEDAPPERVSQRCQMAELPPPPFFSQYQCCNQLLRFVTHLKL